jgi:hypothetical protein
MTRVAAHFLAVTLGALVAGAPSTAVAEQPAKVFRIGILSPAEQTSTKIFDAFREGLRGRGYIDGQNIIIEYRLAAGDYSRLPTLASELVRFPVDIIVTDVKYPHWSRTRPRVRSRLSAGSTLTL